MRAHRPHDAASNPRGHRFGAGVVRVLSVTAVAATACAMMAGAASAATAAPSALTPTTTTITSITPSPLQDGMTATIAVAVSPAAATGTVAIAPINVEGSTAGYTCTATLSDGTGSCEVTPPVPSYGLINFVGTYSGDTTDATSVSPVVTLAVQETTTTTVSPATATAGPVTLKATVVTAGEADVSPPFGSGSVTFYNGAAVLKGCGAVSPTDPSKGEDNVATCTTTLAAGTYTINAVYSGDDVNLTSTGTETLTVKASPPAKHATKTHGSAKPRATKLHRVVTLSATVTSPGRTPGGKVTFMWRGQVVCSARLSHGKAHCSIEFLKTGTYRIRAWYAGNSSFDGSHSAFFDVKIKK
jgi:large repetitive protein